MDLKYKCKLCNTECTSKNIGQHLRYYHADLNMTAKLYYDTFLKRENEGICSVCGKPTKFKNISNGYNIVCSRTCNNISIGSKISIAAKNKTIEDKEKINKKREETCLKKYGYTCIFNTYTVEERHNNSILGTAVQKELAMTNSDYYNHPESIVKRKQTCLDRYNYETNLIVPENIIKNIETKRIKYNGKCHSELGLKTITTNMSERMNNPEIVQSYIDKKHLKYNGDTCSINGRNNQRIKVAEKTKLYFNNHEFVRRVIEQKRLKYNGNTISETGLIKLSHNVYAGKYKYNNQIFDSSWELAYYIWLKDNNINFEYHTIKLEYYINGNKHLYLPDFKLDNQLVEIKSNYILEKYTPIEKLQCMLDNSVNIITKNEIKPYLIYCKEQNINLQEFKIKHV